MPIPDLLKRKWLVIFVGWSIFGWLMGIQSYVLLAREGHTVSFWLALERELIYAYLWALLTPGILYLGRHFSFGPKIWVKHGLFHLAMSIIVAVFHKFSFHLISMSLEATTQNPFSFQNIFQVLFSYIDYGAMVYWSVILLDFSLSYYRQSREHSLRSAKLETQLIQAQLQALKMQIKPHFLFNTLNAISVLIEKNPESARQMIVRLSEFLRMTLDREQKEEVTLAEEMDFLDLYLQIEKIRFEDRLQMKLNIDESSLNAFVPTMILQPLVENAMRHGAAKQRETTTIEITAERQNGYIRLRVQDNGPGTKGANITEGIGFTNVRSRLEQYYGAQQQFEAHDLPEGGFLTALAIPYHTTAYRIAK
ncbi:MAG: sensor histidine kinase [Bacteroidota bacterium]